MSEKPTDLDLIRTIAKAKGYTFVTDPDGTERMYRPDGSLALIAEPKKEPEPKK